jgi:hypothetical protein
MPFTSGPIPIRCQCNGRELQRGVIGDAETPIITEARSGGVPQVTVNYGEQIGNLLCARRVDDDPPISEPIAQ